VVAGETDSATQPAETETQAPADTATWFGGNRVRGRLFRLEHRRGLLAAQRTLGFSSEMQPNRFCSLQAVTKVQCLVASASEGHGVNWRLVSDAVSASAGRFRSPRQCHRRYETLLSFNGTPKDDRPGGGGCEAKRARRTSTLEPDAGCTESIRYVQTVFPIFSHRSQTVPVPDQQQVPAGGRGGDAAPGAAPVPHRRRVADQALRNRPTQEPG